MEARHRCDPAIEIGQSCDRRSNATDTLGRRRRDRRCPAGLCLTPTARDLLWFETLHRHGPLSSTYLLAYGRDSHRSEGRAKDRLTNLYHEQGRHGGPYLERPWQQFATYDARYQDLVYEVTESGLKALKEAGRLRENTPTPTGPWVHRYMTASITASIELAARQTNNVRYIFQDEILSRAQTSLRFPVTVDGINRDLIPDALFGLAYREAGKWLYRFFLVEADRTTEPGRSSCHRRKSYERTIRQYRAFVGKGLYKTALKLTAGLVVLNITTNEAHKEALIALAGDLSRNGVNSYMLFTALPHFARIFKPSPIQCHLFASPWQRAGLDAFHIDKP